MNRNLSKLVLSVLFIAIFDMVQAQTTITGSVTDADTNEPLLGVNVLVKGTVLGTITDIQGNFSLTVQSSPPFTLVISYVGYDRQEVDVNAGATQVQVQLAESAILGQEVVISASRVEENTLKSPVSIERMDILDIQSAPSPDFYSSIRNLNGVDFSTQSLTFKSVNARGFGANGNTRFVQLIDGIDNQAPGLNFPVGNVVGISELDLESVELIPGAASALYGPNAIQGILLMRSKSPFDYQGLDFFTKIGVTHVDEEDHPMAPYTNMGLRYAKAFNNKWAFKFNASFLRAQDFIGVDERDQSYVTNFGGTIENHLESNRQNNRFYDGQNVYGDFAFPLSLAPSLNSDLEPFASLFPSGSEGLFSPTGYAERDFVDNTTESLKLGAAIHYRLNDNLEVLGQFNYGLGSSVYTANDRFVLDNLSIWTGKLELRGDNFFVRGYTTQENSGDAYAANTAVSIINQAYYLPDYILAFAGARTAGQGIDAAHAFARQYADNAQQNGLTAAEDLSGGNGRDAYAAGTPEFNRFFNELRNTSIADGGAKFLDKSELWHYEGSYNFKNQIDFADIVVGANFRTYALNSEGTLFALDNSGEEISFNEFGGYLQISKDVIEDVRLQGSVRYDKNENFASQFSPRISGIWEFLDNQNFRASFQRGFRIPTTQDQYIDLDVQTRRLIGRNELLANRYNLVNNTVYTTESVQAAQQSGNVSDLVVAADAYKEFKTEKVNTWEVGYKGLLLDGRLLIDAFYFNSTYQDFGAEIDITQAVVVGADGSTILTGTGAVPDGWETQTGVAHADALQGVYVNGIGQDNSGNTITLQRYGYDTNIDQDINTIGYGLAVEYTFLEGYNVGVNASYNELKDLDDVTARVYNVAFNTPEWRYNVTFGNRKLTDRIGFGLTYRWQDAFLWQSAIGSGVIPDFATLDAQVTYSIPSLNARVKIGGANITNERYTTSLSNPRLGALYYVQLNLDNILSNFK